MRERQKLIEVFNDPLTSGIFYSLQSLDVPWKNENIVSELDLAFITNYGARNISPLVKTCLDENGKLTTAKQNLIASTLYHLNKVNWIKEYNTLLFEYNPIENYSMIETHTGSDTVTDTPTDWKETETQTPTNWKESRTETVGQDGYTETETQTPTDWKETTKGLQADNQADADNSIYAFNSASAVKVSESTSKVSSKSEVERTGTFETAKTIEGEKITDTERTGTYETEKETSGKFETETERTGTYETETERTGTYEKETAYDTELRRSGNIGNS